MEIYQKLFYNFKPKLKDPKNITDLEVLENSVLAYQHFRENRRVFLEYYPLTIHFLNENTAESFNHFFEYTMFVEAVKTLIGEYEGSIPLIRAEKSLYDILYRTRYHNDVKLKNKRPIYTDEEILSSFSFEVEIVEELKEKAKKIREENEKNFSEIFKRTFLETIVNSTISTILVLKNRNFYEIKTKGIKEDDFWSKVIEDLSGLYSKKI